MIVYYGGCEQPGWRALLADNGVQTMSLSWYGLRRRRKHLSDYRISAEFPEGARVYLDSGAYSVNKNTDITREEAYDLYQEYMDFVDRNIADIEFASEFDALVLGQDLIRDIRAQYWEHKDPEKWMPVWHSQYGLTELRNLASSYERVGVLQTDGESREIRPTLHTLRSGTSFHGVSMTKIEAMKELPLTSVSSTSWLSPSQYGDTFVWDGQDLHRYPRDYKHRRETHRRWFLDNGFDAARIEADDSAELLRLSIWSWQNFARSITPRGVTSNVLDPFGQIAETDPAGVAITPPETRNGTVAVRADKIPLPLLATEVETSYAADGTETQRRIMRSPGVNLMQCNTCHVNDVCPMFRANSDCAYEFPVEIRTTTQLAALMDTLIELQTGRVLRGTFFEQLQGGALDKGTSEEYDRLTRMIRNKVEASRDTVSIKIEATSSGMPGMVSRIFGSEAGERATALPAPLAVEGIIDAEILDE